MGLWYRDGSYVYKIYAWIISGGLTTASLSMIVCVIVRFGEEDVMNSLYYLPGLLCGPIKHICFRDGPDAREIQYCEPRRTDCDCR
jgi:hypothetical protein